jgi:tetratricopeptide (TPR) repeat protein
VEQGILEQAEALVGEGRARTLEAWLNRLPREVLESNPWLLYRLGQCRFVVDMHQARPCFERAFDGFVASADAAGAYLSWVGQVDSVNYAFDDFKPIAALLDRFARLRREFPHYPSLEIRARVTASHLLATLLVRPNAKKVRRIMQLAEIIFRILPLPASRVMIGGQLANYYGMMGRIDKLTAVIAQLEPAVRREQGAPFLRIHSLMALTLSGWMIRHNDFRQYLKQGLQLAQDSGIHVLDNLLLGHGVYGSLIAGDYAQAQAYLERQRNNLDESRRMDIAHYHFQKGWFKLLLGERVKAEESLRIGLQLGISVSRSRAASPAGC